MKKILLSAVIAASILSFYNCKDTASSEEKSLTKEIIFKKEGELTLMKAVTDSIIAQLDIETRLAAISPIAKEILPCLLYK